MKTLGGIGFTNKENNNLYELLREKRNEVVKEAFIFLKTAEKVMNGEIRWLEPKKDPILGAYLVFSANDSDMERVTIHCSNLFSLDDYITPDLFFQLQSLKEHMGIDSFANYQ